MTNLNGAKEIYARATAKLEARQKERAELESTILTATLALRELVGQQADSFLLDTLNQRYN